MLDARFSHLYFYQSLNRLQRGLSAIAELLVIFDVAVCPVVSFPVVFYSDIHVYPFVRAQRSCSCFHSCIDASPHSTNLLNLNREVKGWSDLAPDEMFQPVGICMDRGPWRMSLVYGTHYSSI